MHWVPAFPLAELPPGSARVFKHGTEAIAIFHRPDGLYAIDNRCPHEGYPLVQGQVCGAVLTCAWHNYKFDLRDGACVLGEEAVRAWPLRVVDGVVEVDLAVPPERVAALWHSLDEGLRLHRNGRVFRDLVRLLDAGVAPARLARHAAEHDARHGEYGPTHAGAVAAEVLPDLAEDAPLALAQAFDVAGRGNIRREPRPPAPPIDPGEDRAGARFLAAVEAEDAPTAEGLVRGAAARGWHDEVRAWFYSVCAAHFLDFGHPLIYVHAYRALLEADDFRGAAELYAGWAFGAVHATREDLLPPWAAFRGRPVPPAGAEALDREALVDADPKAAAATLHAADEAVLAAASLAAAERLLRFEAPHDADPGVQEGWLDVSHRLTVVEATRRALALGADRRLLAMLVHFLALCRPLDGPRQPTPVGTGDLDRLAAAVHAHDAETALAEAHGAWHADRAGLARRLRALARADVHQRSIFVAHDIKTVGTGLREATLLDDPRPMLGAVRLLASPIRERAVARLVHEGLRLVREGKPPRTLT